jgi:hypothetical protein
VSLLLLLRGPGTVWVPGFNESPVVQTFDGADTAPPPGWAQPLYPGGGTGVRQVGNELGSSNAGFASAYTTASYGPALEVAIELDTVAALGGPGEWFQFLWRVQNPNNASLDAHGIEVTRQAAGTISVKRLLVTDDVQSSPGSTSSTFAWVDGDQLLARHIGDELAVWFVPLAGGPTLLWTDATAEPRAAGRLGIEFQTASARLDNLRVATLTEEPQEKEDSGTVVATTVQVGSEVLVDQNGLVAGGAQPDIEYVVGRTAVCGGADNFMIDSGAAQPQGTVMVVALYVWDTGLLTLNVGGAILATAQHPSSDLRLRFFYVVQSNPVPQVISVAMAFTDELGSPAGAFAVATAVVLANLDVSALPGSLVVDADGYSGNADVNGVVQLAAPAADQRGVLLYTWGTNDLPTVTAINVLTHTEASEVAGTSLRATIGYELWQDSPGGGLADGEGEFVGGLGVQPYAGAAAFLAGPAAGGAEGGTQAMAVALPSGTHEVGTGDPTEAGTATAVGVMTSVERLADQATVVGAGVLTQAQALVDQASVTGLGITTAQLEALRDLGTVQAAATTTGTEAWAYQQTTVAVAVPSGTDYRAAVDTVVGQAVLASTERLVDQGTQLGIAVPTGAGYVTVDGNVLAVAAPAGAEALVDAALAVAVAVASAAHATTDTGTAGGTTTATGGEALADRTTVQAQAIASGVELTLQQEQGTVVAIAVQLGTEVLKDQGTTSSTTVQQASEAIRDASTTQATADTTGQAATAETSQATGTAILTAQEALADQGAATALAAPTGAYQYADAGTVVSTAVHTAGETLVDQGTVLGTGDPTGSYEQSYAGTVVAVGVPAAAEVGMLPGGAPQLDDYSGADASPLPAPWAGPLRTGRAQLHRQGGQALPIGTGAGQGMYRTDVLAADTEAWVVLGTKPTADAAGVALYVRAQDPGHATLMRAYVVALNPRAATDVVRFYRLTAGVTFTQLGLTVNQEWVPGDLYVLRVVDDTISLYCQPAGGGPLALVTSRTDTQVVGAGYTGLELTYNGLGVVPAVEAYGAAALTGGAAGVAEYLVDQGTVVAVAVPTYYSADEDLTIQAGTVTAVGVVAGQAVLLDSASVLGVGVPAALQALADSTSTGGTGVPVGGQVLADAGTAAAFAAATGAAAQLDAATVLALALASGAEVLRDAGAVVATAVMQQLYGYADAGTVAGQATQAGAEAYADQGTVEALAVIRGSGDDSLVIDDGTVLATGVPSGTEQFHEVLLAGAAGAAQALEALAEGGTTGGAGAPSGGGQVATAGLVVAVSVTTGAGGVFGIEWERPAQAYVLVLGKPQATVTRLPHGVVLEAAGPAATVAMVPPPAAVLGSTGPDGEVEQ